MFSEPRASKTPFDRTETIETYARRVSIAETRARVAIARVRSDARIPSRAREVTPGERTAPAGSPRPIPARRATPESTRVRSNSTFSSNRPRVRRRHASARASESAARAFEKASRPRGFVDPTHRARAAPRRATERTRPSCARAGDSNGVSRHRARVRAVRRAREPRARDADAAEPRGGATDACARCARFSRRCALERAREGDGKRWT